VNSNNAALEALSSSRVYPNPFGNTLHLTFKEENGGNAVIELIGLNGNIVLRRNSTVRKGMNTIDLETSAVSSGVYFIKVNSKKTGYVMKP
jgi:hypothetical protein